MRDGLQCWVFERIPFPQELIEMVVDNFHDVATLEVFTLLSRSFSTRSKKYRFEHIDLFDDTCKKDGHESSKNFALCERFWLLLRDSPHIIPLIKSLRIHLYAYRPERRGRYREKDLGPSFQQCAEKFLPDALNLLTGLRTFSIGGLDEWRSLQWYHLQDDLRLALTNVFRSPILERAEFDYVGGLPFFAMFMNMFNPALKHLSLTWCAFSEYWCEGRVVEVDRLAPKPVVPKLPPIRLESLRLITYKGHVEEAVEYLSISVNRFDFGHIRT